MNVKIIAKTVSFAVIIVTAFPQAFCTEPTIADRLNDESCIIVVQPDGLNDRLKRKEIAATEVTIDESIDSEQSIVGAVVPKVRAGYRIQVFDDNNVRTAKQEAQNRKGQILSKFPHLNAYISFNSPYWRVKVGDFTTRSEAEAVMAEIRQQFPSMAQSLRIVRDRIKQQ